MLPFYKSKLMSIHLFCVCKTEHLFNQNYGFNKLIEPLVEDMKILGSEQGYTFSVVNGLVSLRGSTTYYPVVMQVDSRKVWVGL